MSPIRVVPVNVLGDVFLGFSHRVIRPQLHPLVFDRSPDALNKDVVPPGPSGRITCLQCNAKSKRTGIQCRAPAAKGKTKCRFHGGASTGPKTEQGRQRCADAKTIHGNETRKAENDRAKVMRRLRMLEDLGYELGIMNGSRTPGRKSRHGKSKSKTIA